MLRFPVVTRLAGAALLMAAGCGQQSPPPAPPETPADEAVAVAPSPSPGGTPSISPPRTIWSYLCDDGTPVTAEPLDPSGDLVVTTPSRSARMWLVERNAAGARYASSKMEATLEGESLRLRIDRGRPLTCRRQAPTSAP